MMTSSRVHLSIFLFLAFFVTSPLAAKGIKKNRRPQQKSIDHVIRDLKSGAYVRAVATLKKIDTGNVEHRKLMEALLRLFVLHPGKVPYEDILYFRQRFPLFFKDSYLDNDQKLNVMRGIIRAYYETKRYEDAITYYLHWKPYISGLSPSLEKPGLKQLLELHRILHLCYREIDNFEASLASGQLAHELSQKCYSADQAGRYQGMMDLALLYRNYHFHTKSIYWNKKFLAESQHIGSELDRIRLNAYRGLFMSYLKCDLPSLSIYYLRLYLQNKKTQISDSVISDIEELAMKGEQTLFSRKVYTYLTQYFMKHKGEQHLRTRELLWKMRLSDQYPGWPRDWKSENKPFVDVSTIISGEADVEMQMEAPFSAQVHLKKMDELDPRFLSIGRSHEKEKRKLYMRGLKAKREKRYGEAEALYTYYIHRMGHNNGMLFNNLAIVYGIQNRHLDALYFYTLALKEIIKIKGVPSEIIKYGINLIDEGLDSGEHEYIMNVYRDMMEHLDPYLERLALKFDFDTFVAAKHRMNSLLLLPQIILAQSQDLAYFDEALISVFNERRRLDAARFYKIRRDARLRHAGIWKQFQDHDLKVRTYKSLSQYTWYKNEKCETIIKNYCDELKESIDDQASMFPPDLPFYKPYERDELMTFYQGIKPGQAVLVMDTIRNYEEHAIGAWLIHRNREGKLSKHWHLYPSYKACMDMAFRSYGHLRASEHLSNKKGEAYVKELNELIHEPFSEVMKDVDELYIMRQGLASYYPASLFKDRNGEYLALRMNICDKQEPVWRGDDSPEPSRDMTYLMTRKQSEDKNRAIENYGFSDLVKIHKANEVEDAFLEAQLGQDVVFSSHTSYHGLHQGLADLFNQHLPKARQVSFGFYRHFPHSMRSGLRLDENNTQDQLAKKINIHRWFDLMIKDERLTNTEIMGLDLSSSPLFVLEQSDHQISGLEETGLVSTPQALIQAKAPFVLSPIGAMKLEDIHQCLKTFFDLYHRGLDPRDCLKELRIALNDKGVSPLIWSNLRLLEQ